MNGVMGNEKTVTLGRGIKRIEELEKRTQNFGRN